MMDSRARSVGGYLLRLVGGVSIIVGILGAFTSLTQPNLTGLLLSVVFVAGGAFLVKRAVSMRRRPGTA